MLNRVPLMFSYIMLGFVPKFREIQMNILMMGFRNRANPIGIEFLK